MLRAATRGQGGAGVGGALRAATRGQGGAGVGGALRAATRAGRGEGWGTEHIVCVRGQRQPAQYDLVYEDWGGGRGIEWGAGAGGGEIWVE